MSGDLPAAQRPPESVVRLARERASARAGGDYAAADALRAGIEAAGADLPCHSERHRGYHDSDPAVRDRESRRTYDRMLRRFRGRTDLLAPRP